MRYPLAALSALCLSVPALAQDVKVGGTLEFNYTYSFNKPSTTTVPYYFNRQVGQFSLNYGEIHVYSDPTKERPSGFSIRLVDGAVVAGLPLNLAGINTNTTMFYEAYGRVVHDLGGTELTLDAGLFPTHVGFETIPIGTNSFLSKSFHFGQLQPFYHGGLRASLPIGSGATFTGLLFNRYSGVDSNGNTTPGVGFQVSKPLGSTASVYVNGAFARDTVAGAERPKNILNVVANKTLSEATSLALDLSAVSGKQAGNANYTANGVTAYLFHTLGSGDKVALRAETLSENTAGGVLLFGGNPATKPTVSSLTASYEFGKMAKAGSRTFLELRHDRANSPVFANSTGVQKTNTSLSFVQTFSF